LMEVCCHDFHHRSHSNHKIIVTFLEYAIHYEGNFAFLLLKYWLFLLS
jgi:hypothetical protein